jgi:hypothetical protein
MSNQQKLSKLKQAYGAGNVVIAEAFVTLLKIRKSDKLYPSAVEWAVIRIDSSSDILSARDSKEFAKDNKEKKIGRVHKKIIEEIKNLYKINEVIEGIKPVTSSKLDQTISTKPLPKPDSGKVVTPEIKLESNAERIEKGGSVTLTWTSKNATKIKRTNIPGVTTKTPVNGFIQVEDIRRRRDFYIIVESASGQTQEAKVQTLVETQEYKKQKETEEPKEKDSSTQPRAVSSTRLISPSTKKESTEEKEKIIPQENSLNDNILLSIDKTLSGILKLLTTQLKLNQNIFDKERIKSETKLRLSKEERMEESGGIPGGELIKSGAEKMLSPFKAIIDKIVNFLYFTLLGRVFTEIMDWMNDPQNKDKVDAIGRFIKDAWPLIVGLSVLFLTPLFGFIVGTVQFLTGTYKTLKGLKGLIDRFIFKKGVKPGAKPGAKPSGRPKVTKGTGGTTPPKKPSGSGPKITGSGAKPGFKMPKFRPSGGNIASAVIGFGLETGTNLIFGNIRENMALNAAEKINLLPENEKKQAIEKIKQQIKTQEKLGILGNSETINYLKYVLENVDSSTSNAQTLSVGGKVFSGQVTNKDGKQVSGAGKDTQAFPIMGGGIAVLQPGETVLQPGVRENIIKERDFDVLAYNKGPNANNPQSLSANIKLMNTGGIVGGGTSPKISVPDYHTLLAVTALESDEPQGRADVAQSIYNRLHAADKYKVNFLQKSTTLKDLINANQQYEPTFDNQKDWQNIGDSLESAAMAVMNSSKGRRYNWTLEDAMSQIKQTEKAIKDPALQKNSQEFVKGLTSFRGTSEHSAIRKDLGDVLRNNKSNFFTLEDLEKNYPDYAKERALLAAPIPDMLLPKKKVELPTQQKQNPLQQVKNVLGGVKSNVQQMISPVLQQKQNPLQQVKNLLGGVKSNVQQMISPVLQQKQNILQPVKNVLGGIKSNVQNLIPFMQKKKYGGLIESFSGDNLPYSQDNILMRAEKGEYVIPKIATEKIGIKVLDTISSLDPNFKIKNSNINLDSPRPLSRASYGAAPITLPPITQGMEQVGSSSGSGTPIPVFSATPQNGMDVRSALADIYGIVG